MISSSKRLNTKLFKEIMMKGSLFHGNFFIIRCSDTLKNSRFGVSVPKKVANNAVDRNRLRRRMYSLLRSLNSQMILNKNIVFIMKSGSEKVDFIELDKDIRKIFVKMGLLK